MPSIQVTKASGDVETFDEEKLKQNLKFSKVPDDVAVDAVNYVKNKLEQQVTSRVIHDYVHEYLREHKLIGPAMHYDLKNALTLLGPTGYPFEKFIAKVLAAFGYLTAQGVTVNGKCVTHEVDVDAQKDGEHYFIECKFHNAGGIKTEIQVALYAYARFLDIRSAALESSHSEKYHQPWLVTNTKITKDVIAYAKCVDMKVLAWGYPAEGSLRELILGSGLHPVSVLQGLSMNQLQSLYEHDIVTCADMKRAIDNNQLPVTYTPEVKQNLLAQIREVCV